MLNHLGTKRIFNVLLLAIVLIYEKYFSQSIALRIVYDVIKTCSLVVKYDDVVSSLYTDFTLPVQVYESAAFYCPAMFFQLHKPPVFIDEVQYAPELFTY